jgi:cytochrome P450
MTPERAFEIARSFDLRAMPADFLANPYPVYDLLRSTEPVKRMPDGSLFLTRHADLVRVYKDAVTFSSDKKAEFTPKYGAESPLLAHHTTSLVFNDPPLHSRVRRLIMGALTRRAIDELEDGLCTLVDGLLDNIAAKGGGCLIEDFASAIPIEVIGNLLAIPHADRAPLRAWSLAILGALEPALSPAQEAAGNRAVTEFCDYLRTLIAHRRQHPGNPEHDVLTRLIAGEAGTNSGHASPQAAEPLSEQELLHNCIFILNAGHETTTNLIGNALVALQDHPDKKAQLLHLSEQDTSNRQRHSELFSQTIDEFLRFESSNQLGNRRAVQAFDIDGQTFPAGTLITLCIGAANRDPEVFEQPNELVWTRQTNKHLAFGYGIHQCAGLSLARLEGRIAISHFLARFPNYALGAAPTRGGRARFRGFLAAPFTLN